MKIYLVRHGHPNYRDDCLTELGRLQAEAAARRLEGSGIEKIYSSSCGRAVETAEYTAKALGLDGVELCDFMREIPWGQVDGRELFENGHPWATAEYMAAMGEDILNPNWMTGERFNRNRVVAHVQGMIPEIDKWTASLGYERDGLYYRVGENTDRTVAMFSHGGASSVLVSRLFNLPFPFVCSAICPDFTAVTVICFSDKKGALAAPKFGIMNDARHIEGITAEKFFGR